MLQISTLMSSWGLSKPTPKILCCCLLSTWLNGLQPCYARIWTTLWCSMTPRMKCSSCPSSGSSLSIENFSTQPYARRAASGLVKVLCKPNDSTAGGKGSQKGQPLKQGGALAKFNEWFGSMSSMNTLYVWFPASWGPSVVEAISKRNQAWLQQHPVYRDPAIFNASEVENGPASREMTYKIQKWNVNSPEVHPILVANARVDWMSLEDSELTQQCGQESSEMSSLNVRPRHGKECNRKGLLCRYSYQAVAQLTNGWISCNHSASFGRL